MNNEAELVEIDPATGEVDHLIESGTFAQMSRGLKALLSDFEDDWDTFEQEWPRYRVQPAA